ncbi:hypothetical protein [Francisella noatunensis]|uniref:hypothetical protein n=2 Tax=Francisella noatunensis TaxID=657445 RepID=UPI001F234694|nr:hypothetical protein [Francisella noatunensis]
MKLKMVRCILEVVRQEMKMVVYEAWILSYRNYFPNILFLNKVDKINNTDEMSHTTGTSIITDVIPEININGNTYKNCIRMDNNVTQCFNKDHGNTCNHIIDYEIYCKGIVELLSNLVYGN